MAVLYLLALLASLTLALDVQDASDIGIKSVDLGKNFNLGNLRHLIMLIHLRDKHI